MDSNNMATWIMVCIAGVGAIGAMMSYFIKQNNRLTVVETKITHLSELAETVQNLTIEQAETNVKLQQFLEIQHNGRSS